MSFSLTTLWHERNRFLPGVLAVAFSALLITVQFGIMLGLLSLTSVPVDMARADLWCGDPHVLSVDVTEPIPEAWLTRVKSQPEVDRVENYIIWLMMADKPGSQKNICTVVGTCLDDNSLGALPELGRDLRSKLSEPGSVVVDESDRQRLGFEGIGDYAEVSRHRVRLVGTITGVRSLAGPYLFCSLETAQHLVSLIHQKQTVYLLASCKDPADAPAVAERMRRAYPDMATMTKREFSNRTRWHWLITTKTGVAVGGGALLALIVGAVVTSQTLYAATAASLKEYATLRALGIPRWRIASAVLTQSAWIGGLGVAIALPLAYLVAHAVDAIGAKAILPLPLVVASAVVTIVMSLLSGLAALRSLRLMEPAQLLR
ncbi:MAG TPA: ABC transporter permease [Gemmataceae bacterium]|jgi:putative ABC transport system permease protein|nr:ABC transporter permease [Gemmataceae bacterium]